MALPPINQSYLAYLEQKFGFSPFQQRLIARHGGTGSEWLLGLLGIADKYQKYRRLRQVGRRGIPLMTTLIQANSLLFKPGNMTLPCLVLFSFDGNCNNDAAFMDTLAHRVFDFKNTSPHDPEQRYVAQLTTNERAVRYRRRPLPTSFTGGPVAFVADLWIERALLPAGFLTERRLPCLAEPGGEGALELLPWWIAAGQENPSPR